MNDLVKMKALVKELNEANEAYYQKDAPVMTDYEYDKKMVELKLLEKMTGVRFADSPSGRIPSDASAVLQTVTHSKPMLSCQKTKSIYQLAEFADRRDVVVSWKLDGLTLVLRYDKGHLQQAITRGHDGLVGEDVTHTVRHIRNIPQSVACKEPFEVRGEGVVSWEDHAVLSKLSDSSSHPRNVAAGAVRRVDPERGKLAHMSFVAFELIKKDAPKYKTEQLQFLKDLRFETVEHALVSCSEEDALKETIERVFSPKACRYPVDGVVVEFNSLTYGRSLGATAHHEKRMMALKWEDELYDTVFRGVELSTTRTGAVSIVAVFDEVTIEGTTVHRAGLHNLNVFERFRFGVGDHIRVYKANRIIPQIAENVTQSGGYTLPAYCPCCATKLTVRHTTGATRELYCPNEQCLSRNAHRVARFCDKNAMKIEGMSAAAIETMMSHGWIRSIVDLYHLEAHREEICRTNGFGPSRFEAIQKVVNKSRRCQMYQLLVGLGIPLIGPESAKVLHQYYYGDIEAFREALETRFYFSHIDGVNPAQERSIHRWYEDPANQTLFAALLRELSFAGTGHAMPNRKTAFFDTEVVITGTFDAYKRDELTSLLEAFGARVSDRVTADTDYLLYGTMPGSKKVGEAMRHGTPMLSQTQVAQIFLEAQ